MGTTQDELRIILKTVAETAGADQVRQRLGQVQQQAQQTQVASTSMARSSASALLAFAGAAGVASISAGTLASVIGDAVDAQRDHERLARATAAAYGQNATQFTRFAAALEAQTGFTRDAILEAALSARTLSTNYGLTIDQTQKLISASADLARIRGIGVAESFERVQSAIRGEAEASEFLGLTLNDTFIANNAMNGSLKSTFNTMTDQQKAQVRYTELLRQTASFSGLARDQTDSLDGSFRKAATSGRNAQLALGEMAKPATILGLKGAATALDLIRQQMEAIGRLGPAGLLLGAGGAGGAIGGQLARTRIAEAEATRQLVDQERLLARLRDLNDIGPRKGEAEAERARIATERTRNERELRRLGEINQLPTRAFAAEAARVALLDQLDAAARGVVASQREQEQLQRQSVALSAQEAQIKLGLLPTQERLASLQRAITDQQARARLASLPATEALEDTNLSLERARLVIADRRGQSLDDRRAAFRQIHDLSRNVLPGQELAAFDARASLVASARAGERVGLQGQILDVAAQGALAGVGSSLQGNQLQQQIVAALVDSQKQVLKDIIDAAKGQPIQLVVNITDEGGTTRVVEQLIEAAGQAQTPPVIQISGVRR